MEGQRFAALARWLTGALSRRGLLRGLAGAVLGLGAAWPPEISGARKTGKKRSRAHGAGPCDPSSPGFCTAADPVQALCNGSLSCVCLETTGGSTFCGSLAARASGCADCRNDADCLALGAPPGSACVPFSAGACAGACESGMLCVAPCDDAAAKPPNSPVSRHAVVIRGADVAT